jgi:hypothetical protein
LCVTVTVREERDTEGLARGKGAVEGVALGEVPGANELTVGVVAVEVVGDDITGPGIIVLCDQNLL